MKAKLAAVATMLLFSCGAVPKEVKTGLEHGTPFQHELIELIELNYRHSLPEAKLQHLSWYVVDMKVLRGSVCSKEAIACIFTGSDVVFLSSELLEPPQLYLAEAIAHEMMHEALSQLVGNADGSHSHEYWNGLLHTLY